MVYPIFTHMAISQGYKSNLFRHLECLGRRDPKRAEIPDHCDTECKWEREQHQDVNACNMTSWLFQPKTIFWIHKQVSQCGKPRNKSNIHHPQYVYIYNNNNSYIEDNKIGYSPSNIWDDFDHDPDVMVNPTPAGCPGLNSSSCRRPSEKEDISVLVISAVSGWSQNMGKLWENDRKTRHRTRNHAVKWPWSSWFSGFFFRDFSMVGSCCGELMYIDVSSQELIL